jgi:hypothetical protein
MTTSAPRRSIHGARLKNTHQMTIKHGAREASHDRHERRLAPHERQAEPEEQQQHRGRHTGPEAERFLKSRAAPPPFQPGQDPHAVTPSYPAPVS